MTITYRSAKGANLTPTEVDNNFLDLDARLASLEGSGGLAGLSISNVVVSGNEVTFYREDGESWGPYVMSPVRFDWRGAWAVSTAYYSNDVITNGGKTYLVLRSHTSDATTFNPDAVNGSSQQLYALMIDAGVTFPAGGTTGQVLAKASDADYDTIWQSGGGGGGTSFDGASVMMDTNQVGIYSQELPMAYVEFASSSDWYTSTSGSPIKLRCPLEAYVEIGFQCTATNVPAGDTVEFYVYQDTGSFYGGQLPIVASYCSAADGNAIGNGSTMVWVSANSEFSLWVTPSTGPIRVPFNGCSFWIRKIATP